MRYIIEVEEMVKMIHQVVVDASSDAQIEEALENVSRRCESLYEFVDSISNVVPVIEVNEEYYVETDSIEYYDDYVIGYGDDEECTN